jgi:hypothetical protein
MNEVTEYLEVFQLIMFLWRQIHVRACSNIAEIGCAEAAYAVLAKTVLFQNCLFHDSQFLILPIRF